MNEQLPILGDLFLNKTKKDGTPCTPYLKGRIKLEDGSLMYIKGFLSKDKSKFHMTADPIGAAAAAKAGPSKPKPGGFSKPRPKPVSEDLF